MTGALGAVRGQGIAVESDPSDGKRHGELAAKSPVAVQARGHRVPARHAPTIYCFRKITFMVCCMI